MLLLVLPNWIYDCNINSNRIPTKSYILQVLANCRSFSKSFMEKSKISRIVIILKKNKAKGLTLPNFKTRYKVTVIKTVWQNS